MNTKSLILGVLVTLSLASMTAASSVSVVGDGSTFIINKNGGFDGVDGASREAAFVAAAQVWADILVSPVAIVVDAEFSTSLYCASNSATLGSAGPLSTSLSGGADSMGLQNNVWYPTALINSKNGSDYFADSADITAQFNANIGNANCLSSSGWYYGTDGNAPSNLIDFYEVVLHELGHGLGILSLANSSGAYPQGITDIFSTFLKDQQTNKQWTAMNDSERAASMLNDGHLVWSGAGVTALASQLSAGVNSGNVQMYAPSSYEGGSSVSHFDTELAPNELMEPQYTGNASLDHSIALLEDIGWTLFVSTNSAPVITGQASLSVDEDSSITLSLSDLTVTDADNSYPADFSLTVNGGSNYSVSGLEVTPAADFSGMLTVPVAVNDGTDSSANYNLSITVNSINDKPVITAQNALAVDEDSSLTLKVADLTIADPDSSVYSLNIATGSNYSVSGAQVTPNANFNGSLTVPVTVNDGEVDSDSFDLSITVNAVNDKPAITGAPTVSIIKNATQDFVLADFQTSDIENNTLTLQILDGMNYSLSGNSVTPEQGFTGTLSIGARVFDGFLYSDNYIFDALVTQANSPPVISQLPTVDLLEDQSVSLSISDFTIVDSDSSEHSLTLLAGDHYSIVGSNIIPDENYNGVLNVDLYVSDAFDNSSTETLTIIVSPVNDAPVLSANTIATSLVIGDAYSAQFNVSDIDSNNLTFSLATEHDWLSINNIGLVTGTAPKAAIGTQLVTVSVSDGDSIDAISFDLTVIDDDQADLAVALSLDEPLILENESALLTATVSNNGPAQTVSGHVLLSFAEANFVDSLPLACQQLLQTQIQCDFSDMAGSIAFELSMGRQNALTQNITAQVFSDENDAISSNNSAVTTLTVVEQITSAELSISLLSGVNTQAIEFADLNNDGKQEVLFANTATTTEQVFEFNNDFDTATLHSHLTENLNARDIATADFNGDDRLDIVVANEGANHLYLNLGDGVMSAPQTLGNANSFDVLVVDLNNDEFADLVFANEGANGVYLNDQSGHFVASVPVGDSSSAAIASLDFNADGYADLIVANSDADDLIYLNNGSDQSAGIFNLNAVIVGSQQTSSHAVQVVDLNQDGNRTDILIGKTITSANETGLDHYRLNGSVLTLVQQIAVASLKSFDVADYDADGDEDLLVLQQNQVIQLFIQESEQFMPLHSYLAVGAQSVRMVDMNGDDVADIGVAYSAQSESKLYISDNPFRVSAAPALAPEEPQPQSAPAEVEPIPPSSTDQEQEPEVVVVQSGSLAGVCFILGVLLLAIRRAKPNFSFQA